LADEAFQDIAIPGLARIRQIFAGGSLSENESNISKQFEEIRKQQEAAAALEDQLRQEQISLVQTQKDLLIAERQFFDDQLLTLQTIAAAFNQNKDITDIRNQVDRLFNQPLPTTSLDETLRNSPELKALRDQQAEIESQLNLANTRFNQENSIQSIIDSGTRGVRGRPGLDPFEFPDDEAIGSTIGIQEAAKILAERRKNDPNLQDLSKQLEDLNNKLKTDEASIIKEFFKPKSTAIDNSKLRTPVLLPDVPARQFVPRTPETAPNNTTPVSPFTGLPIRGNPNGIAPTTISPNTPKGISPSLIGPGGIAPSTVTPNIDKFDPTKIFFMDPRKASRALRNPLTGNTASTVGTTAAAVASVTPPQLPNFDEIGKNVVGLVDLLTANNGLLEKIANGGIVSRFEVAPIQVNVALTVPDVMNLVGSHIKQEVIKEVTAKLGNIFSDDAETFGRINSLGV